jgi:ABC-type multidrug transport system ATPase subunit
VTSRKKNTRTFIEPVEISEDKRVPSIQFTGMTKKFGSFTAVDNLKLNLYKDEIFCFLGHNGAGKTTSLNVLMGKETPTLGTVLINLN